MVQGSAGEGTNHSHHPSLAWEICNSRMPLKKFLLAQKCTKGNLLENGRIKSEM